MAAKIPYRERSVRYVFEKILCLAAAACLTVSAAVFADTPQPPEISAHAAYVMDADTGDTLYAKMPMTGLILAARRNHDLHPRRRTGQAQGKLDQPINITKDVYDIESDASVLGIDPGDQITLRNAMTGMMTVSGCDATIAVAETVTPSQADFVAKMNEKQPPWAVRILISPIPMACRTATTIRQPAIWRRWPLTA